jgi:hypothetical protein
MNAQIVTMIYSLGWVFLQFGRNWSRLTLKKLWWDVKTISAYLIFFKVCQEPQGLEDWKFSYEGQKLKLPYISIWYFFWLQIARWFQKCTKMYKNVQKCTKMYKNVQKCTKMYKNVQKCTKMYKLHVSVFWSWKFIEHQKV